MENKHNIDDLFKSGLDDRDLPFDEAAWEATSAYLDKKEEKGGKRRWIGLLLVGFLLGIGTMIYFGSTNESVIVENSIESSNSTIGINNKKESNSIKEITASSVQSTTSISLENEQNEDNKFDKKINNSSARKQAIFQNLSKEKVISDISNKSKEPNGNNSSSNSKKAVTTETTESSISSKINDTKKSTNITNNSKSPIEENLNNSITNQSEDLVLFSTIPFLPFQRISNEFLPKLAVTDIGYSLNNSSKSHQWAFFISGLAGTSFGSYSTQNFYGGGLGIRYRMNRKWSIQSGLVYHLNTLSETEIDRASTITYGFGIQDDLTIQTIHQWHTLRLPILLSRQINKHLFSVGVGLDYMTAGRGSNEFFVSKTEQERSGAENATFRQTLENAAANNEPRPVFRQLESTESVWIDLHNTNRFQPTLLFQYEYQLQQKVKLGMMVEYRLRQNISGKIEQNPLRAGIELSYLIK